MKLNFRNQIVTQSNLSHYIRRPSYYLIINAQSDTSENFPLLARLQDSRDMLGKTIKDAHIRSDSLCATYTSLDNLRHWGVTIHLLSVVLRSAFSKVSAVADLPECSPNTA